jgi:hypothetical protein
MQWPITSLCVGTVIEIEKIYLTYVAIKRYCITSGFLKPMLVRVGCKVECHLSSSALAFGNILGRIQYLGKECGY